MTLPRLPYLPEIDSLPYFGGKGTNKQAENQIKAELFLDLSDILLIFANGNDKKPENK